jgi:hypothetical protein
VFIQNNVETGVAGREDQASPGQDQTPGRSGSFQGGIALFVTRNLKHKAMLMITYSAGLRVSEAARLKLTDIDSVRMTVRISQGKGGKDRYSILSQTTLEHLRQYWKKYRPTEWLFERQKKDGHIGKGVRVPPRDALIAESCTEESRGKAFGLHLSLDNVGSVVGPLFAFALMPYLGNNYRLLFWIAAIPAFLGFGVLVFFATEQRAGSAKLDSDISVKLLYTDTESDPPLRLVPHVKLEFRHFVLLNACRPLVLEGDSLPLDRVISKYLRDVLQIIVS